MLTAIKQAIPMSVRRAVKVNRARAFERAGSHRYSRPGLAGLDSQILPHLPGGAGVFLEIGANDGYSQSNTYYLERVLGWRGVLIEPLPHLARSCQKIRSRSKVFNVACVGPGGPETVELIDLNLMSVAVGMQDREEEEERCQGSSHRRIQAQTDTLSRILDQAGERHVDFMSVDVEGAEMEVLAGLDLHRHTPGHLLVETRRPEQVAHLLGGHMKLQEKLTHHDYLFVAEPHGAHVNVELSDKVR